MKKNIWLFIMIIWGCYSCSDFLEPDSPSEYVPKTVDALNEMLLGDAYPTADKSEGVGLFAYNNMLDDDEEMTSLPIYFKNSVEGFIAVYSWDPQMHEKGLASNIWSGYYQVIMGANAALDYLDEVSGTAAEKAWVRAQVYTLRAFYYFNLVNYFGEPYGYNKNALGVPLKLTSSLSDKFEKRNTVGEVYDQIIKDLDAAEENFMALPVEKRCPASYRINMPAMQLIRARVALHMGNREEAAAYARKVIDDWNYKLYDLRTFTASTTIPYPDFVSRENTETIWTYGDAREILTLCGKTSGYLVNSKEGSADIRTAYVASKSLVDCFGKWKGDLRKTCYLVTEYANKQNTTYMPYSKLVITYNHGYTSTTEFGLAMRLSEAYLILAEAVYDTEWDLALKLVNGLRKYRYSTDEYKEVDYAGDELRDFIREERRRELCFEGQRWFDLRRYGMPSFARQWTDKGTVIGYYVMENEDPAYTLPIPSVVLERNPALVQNKLGNVKVLTQK